MNEKIEYEDLLAIDGESDNSDYKLSITCLSILACASIIPIMVFIFSHNTLVTGMIFGAIFFALSMYHIHFGLLLLYFLLPVESAITLNPYFTISKVVGIVVFLSFLCHLAKVRLIFPPALKTIFIFMGWALLSTIWAAWPLYAVAYLTPVVLNVGLMLILISTVRDRKTFNLIMAALFLGSCAASILVLAGKVVYAGESEEMGRVILSEGTNATVLAADICMGFLAGVYLLMQKGLFKKLILMIILPILLLVILKTQSRTPLATAIMAPVFAFILVARGRKKITYFFVAMLFFIICATGFYIAINSNLLPEKAMERFRSTSYDLKESGRLDMWQQGARLIIQRPLNGWGWNNFAVKIGLGSSLSAAHNNVVALTVELGIVGLGLAAAIYLLLFKDVMRLHLLPLRWLGITMLLFTIMTGMTATTYLQKDFWYALAFVMVLTNIDQSRHDGNLPEKESLDYGQLPEMMS